MFYYNPETKEKLSYNKLKSKLNMSFSPKTEEVEGWYLLHNDKFPERILTI